MSSPAKYWLLPGIAAILFLVALPELFRASNDFLKDPATARHLRAGEIMLERKEILQSDPFGVDQPPRPWVAFEWLFEVSVAALVRIGGLPFAYAVGFLLFALLPILLWRLLMQQQISLPVALLYTLGAGLVFRSHLLLRPVLLTYLLMIVVVAWWYRHREAPGKWSWFVLPLIFAFWANIHGGFAAALLFLGLSVVGRLMDYRVQRRPIDQAMTTWLAILVICANATLLTPHGWRLHQLIWEMVFHIKSFAYWNEFRSLQFIPLTPLALAYLFILGGLALGGLSSRSTRWSWELVLPLLLFLYFGIKVQRHVMLLLVVAAVPVCRNLDGCLRLLISPDLRQRLERWAEIERNNLSYLWIIPAAVALVIPCFLSSSGAKSLRVGDPNISVAAIDFIRTHRSQFQRPLVTTWNAGALVYHLAPDFRITFDDRTEFYGDARLKPYIALLFTKPGWQKTLREGNYDSIILDHDFALVKALRQAPQWQLVYEDQSAVIFLPKP
ncbi:MAG: hypothetical protein B9S32_14670 [Verrucomicrobia bacterium Tous-C9LFEB]|nr:MAG: hypothetical protein B9S32_14670 [Verrucomicrobia bacterium Tous-C9LFEB]